MGQYKIVDNVLVAVMKKSVPEKKKTANLGRRGRARREEYVFEVPEQVLTCNFHRKVHSIRSSLPLSLI